MNQPRCHWTIRLLTITTKYCLVSVSVQAQNYEPITTGYSLYQPTNQSTPNAQKNIWTYWLSPKKQIKKNTLYYSSHRKLPKLRTNWMQIKVEVTHLDEVVCVVGAVDADGVFERGAIGRGEQQQFEAFGCGHAEGLSDQREASELLGEHAARLGLQLAIKRLRHQLLAKQQHVLTYTHGNGVRAQFT